jgi:hypothetical protein
MFYSFPAKYHDFLLLFPHREFIHANAEGKAAKGFRGVEQFLVSSSSATTTTTSTVVEEEERQIEYRFQH